MSQKRVFLLIDLTLVAAAGALIYYLATVTYVEPRQINQALAMLVDTGYGPAPTQNVIDPAKQWPHLTKGNFTRPVIALTPTPTPTPKPTPRKFMTNQMIHGWEVRRMRGDRVTVFDGQTTKETFDMAIGDKRVAEFKGQKMPIELIKIDFTSRPPVAVFKGNGMEVRKAQVFR